MDKKVIFIFFIIINTLFLQIFSQKVEEIKDLKSIQTLQTNDYEDYMLDFSKVDDTKGLVEDLYSVFDDTISYEFSFSQTSNKNIFHLATSAQLPLNSGTNFKDDGISEVIIGTLIENFNEDVNISGIVGNNSYINNYNQMIIYDFDYLLANHKEILNVENIIILNVNDSKNFDKNVEKILKTFDKYSVEYVDGNIQRGSGDFVKDAIRLGIIQISGSIAMLIIVFSVSLDVFLKTIRRKTAIKKLLGYPNHKLILNYCINYILFFAVTIFIPIIMHLVLSNFGSSFFANTNLVGCVILAILQIILLIFILIFQIIDVISRNIRGDL